VKGRGCSSLESWASKVLRGAKQWKAGWSVRGGVGPFWGLGAERNSARDREANSQQERATRRDGHLPGTSGGGEGAETEDVGKYYRTARRGGAAFCWRPSADNLTRLPRFGSGEVYGREGGGGRAVLCRPASTSPPGYSPGPAIRRLETVCCSRNRPPGMICSGRHAPRRPTHL